MLFAMRIGPFNSFHFSQIENLLKKENIPFSIDQDPQALEKIRKKDLERAPDPYPIYQSSGDFLFVDVDEFHAPRALFILDKNGLVPINDEEKTAVLESAEYHCLQCDYVSDHPGSCPHHNQNLLEYSDWVAAKNAPRQSLSGYFGIIIVLIIVAAFYYFRIYLK